MCLINYQHNLTTSDDNNCSHFFVPVVRSEPCVGHPPQPGTAEETQNSPGMNGMYVLITMRAIIIIMIGGCVGVCGCGRVCVCVCVYVSVLF